MKKAEHFPQQNAHVKGFCQLRNLVSDFPGQMDDSVNVHLLVIKTKIGWPNAAQIKECSEILREGQSDTGPNQRAI
jgi:hypothetical protein